MHIIYQTPSESTSLGAAGGGGWRRGGGGWSWTTTAAAAGGEQSLNIANTGNNIINMKPGRAQHVSATSKKLYKYREKKCVREISKKLSKWRINIVIDTFGHPWEDIRETA